MNHDLIIKMPGQRKENLLALPVRAIGLYRENAIAIEGEAKDPFGGIVMCTTSQCK